MHAMSTMVRALAGALHVRSIPLIVIGDPCWHWRLAEFAFRVLLEPVNPKIELSFHAIHIDREYRITGSPKDMQWHSPITQDEEWIYQSVMTP